MYKYIKRFIPFLIFLIIFGILAAVVEIYASLKIKDIIDVVTNNQAGDFASLSKQTLIYALLLLPLVIMLTYLRGLFMRKSVLVMKKRYLKGVFSKNINEFNSDNNANYLSTMTNDFDQIEKNYLMPLLDIIDGITTFIAAVVLFSIASPIILLICAGLLVINLFISVLSSKPLNKHNKERSKLFGDYTSYIKEVLSAFHIIKSNNLEDKVRGDFFDKSYKVQQKGYVIDKISSFIFAIQNANFSFTFITLFLIVGYMAIEGAITFGLVVLILNSIEKLIWPVINVSENLPKMFMVKGIIQKMEDSLKNKDDHLETVSFDDFQKIEFKDLSFSYEDNQVLDNINLEFKKGKKYLIIGPSGGGKSTILRLLRKYFYPEVGDILVDNVPLRDIIKEQYFNNIANIDQNIFLFEDTIRNNLTLYRDYSDEEIYDAISKAGLNDFLNSLPGGLDTIIYDNGKNVSGGEKSRLAIARGLINNSKIIFLDEAFASLDSKKAKEIEKSILNLKDVTIINVSHVVFKEHQDLYDKVLVVKDRSVLAKN
ncbi:MAG: ABC transporter ATP-binding protein/permease [Bacilli bacterium]|nr:ABC transporter ATP-binding protein/permease [Bacilli bacterium]